MTHVKSPQAPGATGLTLAPTAPFSWAHTRAALEVWPSAPDRGRAGADGRWWLAVRAPDAAGGVAVALEPAGTTLVAEAHGATLGSEALAHVARELTWRLALDLETAPLLAAAEKDPGFEPVATALAGFHPPLYASAFQAACWTVIRQRTPPAFAHASVERLVRLLGTAVAAPDGGEPLRLFPRPEELGEEARPLLLAATNNLRKVERLRGLADGFLGVDEAWLRAAPFDEAFAWLVRLPGVGPWSAEQVLWRGMGRYERTPWRDTGALTAIGDVYLRGLTPARGTARELAERYGWLQGLWLRYLKAYPRVAAGLPPPG